jgi:5-methylcytosine-specific restriction endonuclease McrA
MKHNDPLTLPETVQKYKTQITKKLKSYYQQDIKKGRISYNDKYEVWTGYELTIEQFSNILLKNKSTKCYYCEETTYLDNKVKLGSLQLTLDRIDNDKAHTENNCIISCWRCNKTRSNKYTVKQFKKIINKTGLKPYTIRV